MDEPPPTRSILESAARLGLYTPHSQQEDQAPSEGRGVLYAALRTMDSISKAEDEARELELEAEGRRLQGKYGDQAGLDPLSKRTAATRGLSEHLKRVLALDGTELARRVEAPFQQEHLCMERTLHGRMVEVVEGAYGEVCSANQGLELADWCRGARVPLPQLIKIQKAYAAELARCEGAKSSILASANAMRQLHGLSAP
mmetsp:Transcript_46551/g.113363  ORF Transcript_46551/g.113363 Transcript_46551/m.113363 type:complete len:200 (+) Transcript_46551:34-633(+)